MSKVKVKSEFHDNISIYRIKGTKETVRGRDPVVFSAFGEHRQVCDVKGRVYWMLCSALELVKESDLYLWRNVPQDYIIISPNGTVGADIIAIGQRIYYPHPRLRLVGNGCKEENVLQWRTS